MWCAQMLLVLSPRHVVQDPEHGDILPAGARAPHLLECATRRDPLRRSRANAHSLRTLLFNHLEEWLGVRLRSHQLLLFVLGVVPH